MTSEPTQKFVPSQRIPISYWDWGNEGGPPLVLVHGGKDHARQWDRIAQALRDDYHVVALDLRGHGDSGWSPGGTYGLSDNASTSSASSRLLGRLLASSPIHTAAPSASSLLAPTPSISRASPSSKAPTH